MIAKIVLLVLLGTVLVSASPRAEVYNNELVDSQVDRSIEDVWKKLEGKFKLAIELIKETWKTVKEKGQRVLNTNLKNMKEKGLVLLEHAKEVYKQSVIEGKNAAPEFGAIYKSFKDLVVELKQTGSGAVQDAKQLLKEVVEAVKEKATSLKRGN